MVRKLVLAMCLIFAFRLEAAEWSWQWEAAGDEGAPKAEVCRFKYGKEWAYAIEIDDAPMCAATVVQPLLAKYQFTDAPPGVSGGKPLPFVGGVGVIVWTTGTGNNTIVQWEHLKSLSQAGWGMINHGYYHRGHSYDPPDILSREQLRADLFWSQTILASEVGNGRAPSHFIYPNGYLDYRKYMGEYGLRSGSHVAGEPANWAVYADGVDLTNLQRSYLDSSVWLGDWGKKDPMFWFPASGPAKDSLFIDFCHGIDVEGTPHHAIWRQRLEIISSRFGKGGKDNLWCAPTGEILDYVAACRAATVKVERGRVTVRIPDSASGASLTLKLAGIKPTAPLPKEARVYRDGPTMWLTTPMIGLPGSAPPSPRVKRIYVGEVKNLSWAKPVAVAAVRLLQGEPPAKDFVLSLDAVTAQGESKSLLKPEEKKLPETWSRWWLFSTVPNEPAVLAKELRVSKEKALQKMEVWAVEE